MWFVIVPSAVHWRFEHMGSMLGSYVATLTAVLVTNAPRLGLASTSVFVWLGPTIVGVPAIAVWTACYRRKFAGQVHHAPAMAVPDSSGV